MIKSIFLSIRQKLTNIIIYSIYQFVKGISSFIYETAINKKKLQSAEPVTVNLRHHVIKKGTCTFFNTHPVNTLHYHLSRLFYVRSIILLNEHARNCTDDSYYSDHIEAHVHCSC